MELPNKIICPTCGATQRVSAHFCSQCGGVLPQIVPPAAPSEWQRAGRQQRYAWIAGIILLLLILGGAADWWFNRDTVTAGIAEGVADAPVSTAVGMHEEPNPGVASSDTDAAPTVLPTFTPVPDGAVIDTGDLPARRTLEQFLETYPALGSWVGNTELDEEKMNHLYEDMRQLFEDEGIQGVQQFLRESGLLEALNLDPNYIDFIMTYDEEGLEEAQALARERGFLTEDNQLQATLVLDTTNTSELQPQLEALGFTIAAQYENELSVTFPLETLAEESDEDEAAKRTMALLAQLAQLDHVIGVRAPHVINAGHSPSYLPPLRQGVERTGASAWHAAGYLGQGVKIGIVDNSFLGYRELRGTTVPAEYQINWERGLAAGQGHGTAIAEVIHAMAPDAALYLAWTDGSLASTGSAVEWLLDQDVDIISASFGSITGPMDGTGAYVDLVNRATEAGALWVSAAGNYATSHLLMTFTDSDGDGYHEFPGGSERLLLGNTADYTSIALNWNEAWNGGATQDYDMELYEGEIDAVPEGRGANPQNGGAADLPTERIDYRPVDPNNPLYLVIYNYNATGPVQFNLLMNGASIVGSASMPSYSLGTPADAADALTVGATVWDDDELAQYSSQGPTLDERGKPDLTGPTGVESSIYREGFAGTSASTPHVAGAAALVLNAFPDSDPASLRGYLIGNALDLAPAGYDTQSGYGRLNLPSPETIETEPVTARATGSVINVWVEHNVYGEDGKGMMVHTAFNLDDVQGRSLTAAAYFFEATTGNPLPDRDGRYATGLGQVVADHRFSLATSPVQLTDLPIYIPYSQLDVDPGEHLLAFQVHLQQDGLPAESADLDVSEMYAFNFRNNGPASQITSVRANYNSSVGGLPGITFATDFRLQNLGGQQAWMVVFFYFDDGSNRPLRDFNGEYSTYTGNVAVARTFQVTGSDQIFEGLSFSIPYNELHMSPGYYRLKYFAALYDANWVKLAETDWYPFDYTQR